jgi:hypothetical protein
MGFSRFLAPWNEIVLRFIFFVPVLLIASVSCKTRAEIPARIYLLNCLTKVYTLVEKGTNLSEVNCNDIIAWSRVKSIDIQHDQTDKNYFKLTASLHDGRVVILGLKNGKYEILK